jgi:hypothetical protein
VDNAEDAVYFFSANAFGLKGRLPGGKHSWCSIKENNSWTTLEITDIETIEFQEANILECSSYDKYAKQVIVSDRNPGTMWFGSAPSIISYSKNIGDLLLNKEIFPYKALDIKLYKNNCNTYLSYLLWTANVDLKLKYIGFKSYTHWDKLYNV